MAMVRTVEGHAATLAEWCLVVSCGTLDYDHSKDVFIHFRQL